MSERINVMVLPGRVLDDNIKKALPGDIVELAEAEALSLFQEGIVELVEVAPAADDLEALVKAIDQLDTADKALWTKGGKPTTEALSQQADCNVTAKERDTAWALFKERG